MINKIKKYLGKSDFTRSSEVGLHFLRRGFTLIETLVAVMILMTAIVGPLTIVQKGLNATLIAKDQITAFYLAQDAIEYVRFVRDTNKLTPGNTDWLARLDTVPMCVSADGNTSCTIDSLDDTITNCPSNVCPVLYYNPASVNGGQFTYTSGAPSIFTRAVTIQTPISGNANEASTTVRVSWSDTAGKTRSVSVHENMFNWQ